MIDDILRPHQVAPVRELLEIFSRYDSAVDLSDTGCHAKGSPILMFDGSVLPVEDVKVGNLIMGADSKPRKVLSLCRGREAMKRVVPIKGIPFVVNRSHILTLQYTRSSSKSGMGKYSDKALDISVSDFEKLNPTHKRCLKLFRAGVTAWADRRFLLDPYFLGVLIGDGCLVSKDALSICKPDPEIKKVSELIASTFNGFVSVSYRAVNNPTYHLRSCAKLWEILVSMGLGGKKSKDKYIPFEYLTGGWNQRREILAGLLDTDGHLCSGGYDFISASQTVSENVVFLARSLGLAAYINKCEKQIRAVGFKGVYWRVFISGDCSIIPLRIKRKKALVRKQIRNVLRTGFTIETLPEDEYFGFSLDGDGRFLMGDFTVTHNTGKTYVALAVAFSLRLPTLVVCPKISISMWHRVAEQFGDSVSVTNYEKLRTGKTPFGVWENQDKLAGSSDRRFFVCEYCQQKVELQNITPCYCHQEGIHCLNTKNKPRNFGTFKFSDAIRFLIFDEVHRCSALNSLNADMLIAAKRQGIKTLSLSATAACGPLQMRALGYLLDLHGDKTERVELLSPKNSAVFDFDYWINHPHRKILTFYSWAMKRGVKKHPTFRGLHWPLGAEKQKEVLAEIRSQIIPSRGVRVTADEIPGFPECDITAELYDIDAPGKLDGLYQEMETSLCALAEKSIGDAEDFPLTRILRTRQKIELLKVPVAVELTNDYLAKGYSVVLFVNFQQTIEELVERLSCPFIDGRVTGGEREAILENFQDNLCRELVVNCDAGGISISLHDLDGNFPRVGIVFPNFSAVSMRQVFGRLRREGGKSKSFYRVLLAAGTVEESSIYPKLRNKLNNLDALNNSDLCPNNLPFDSATNAGKTSRK